MRWLCLALLAGCASFAPCPSLVDYSAQFQRQLAEEVRQLNRDSALLRAMLDYGALRAQVRACHGED